MAASATFGFSGNPEALTVVSAGSYTIPANKFGHLSGWARAGGTITLDGVTALGSGQATWNALSMGAGGSPKVAHDAGTFPQKHLLAVGESSLAGSKVIDGDAYANATASDSTQGQIDQWVPTGTVINGTGSFGFSVAKFAG